MSMEDDAAMLLNAQTVAFDVANTSRILQTNAVHAVYGQPTKRCYYAAVSSPNSNTTLQILFTLQWPR